MPARILIKILRDSEITFFASHHARQLDHNKNHPDDQIKRDQKALNLPQNVFEDIFYPDISLFFERDDEPLDFYMDIYGPGKGEGIHTPVNVTKSTRNWRLNGYVPDPEGTSRFLRLKDGDLIVMDFDGDGRPKGGRLCFVHKGDRLFEPFEALLAGKTRKSLTREAVATAIAKAKVPANHPMRILEQPFLTEGFLDSIVDDEALVRAVSETPLDQLDLDDLVRLAIARMATNIRSRVVAGGKAATYIRPLRTAPERDRLVELLSDRWKQQSGKCPLCDRPISEGATNPMLQMSPDRIDSSLPSYDDDNLQVTHLACNLAKNASSGEDFREWLDLIRRDVATN